jgi:DNA-binding NarL/FixJ family response regulator
MSRDTVKTHLSHVYAKLGVANRAELAALVARAAPFARGEEGGGSDPWDR